MSTSSSDERTESLTNEHRTDNVPSFADNTTHLRRPGDAARLRSDVDAEGLAASRAQTAAEEVALIRTKLASSGDGHLSRAADVLLSHSGGVNTRLPESDYRQFASRVDHAIRLATQDEALERLERRYREQAGMGVVREIDPYGPASPHSYLCDVMAARASDSFGYGFALRNGDGGHQERLACHAALVARAIEKRTDYGKWIESQLAEGYRQANVEENRRTVQKVVPGLVKTLAERRTLTTGGGATASASGGSAAAFVPPAILVDAWAQYRSPAAVFISCCDSTAALPTYGMQAYVPIVTTGTTVATDSEGSATAEGDPVAGFASGTIVQKAGQVTVSQALLDRVGPGISGDVMLWRQLKDQLASQLDMYALTLVIASGQTVTNSGKFAMTGTSGVGGLLGDLKKAKSKLTDTAGTRLRATHMFGLDDFCDYIAAYADAQGRPLFSPAWDDNRQKLGEGATGYVLAGLDLYGDTNIPNSGSNIQIVVARPDTILQLNGTPVLYLMPQSGAGSLEATIGVRQYTTTIARFPDAVATVSGAAYAASTFQ